MCSRPSAPSLPPMPPPRAMERLPQRGMVAMDARRQVVAGMGTAGTAQPSTVLGMTDMTRQRTASGGAARGTSSSTGGTLSTILGG